MLPRFLQSSHTSDFNRDSPAATLPALWGSALGLVGRVSVYRDWVRLHFDLQLLPQCVNFYLSVSTSISVCQLLSQCVYFYACVYLNASASISVCQLLSQYVNFKSIVSISISVCQLLSQCVNFYLSVSTSISVP